MIEKLSNFVKKLRVILTALLNNFDSTTTLATLAWTSARMGSLTVPFSRM